MTTTRCAAGRAGRSRAVLVLIWLAVSPFFIAPAAAYQARYESTETWDSEDRGSSYGEDGYAESMDDGYGADYEEEEAELASDTSAPRSLVTLTGTGTYKACQRYAQPRGAGKVPALKTCPDGKELHQGLCYKPCEGGWKGVGPVCWKGIKSKGRGAGTVPQQSCSNGRELDEGLCYRKCPPGWDGKATMCWPNQQCENNVYTHPCGFFCTKDAGGCKSLNAQIGIASFRTGLTAAAGIACAALKVTATVAQPLAPAALVSCLATAGLAIGVSGADINKIANEVVEGRCYEPKSIR